MEIEIILVKKWKGQMKSHSVSKICWANAMLRKRLSEWVIKMYYSVRLPGNDQIGLWKFLSKNK